MKLNLRLRLTLFYALVSATILLLGGVVVFAAVRSSIHQNLDDGLRDEKFSTLQFTIEVSHRQHLARVLRQLRQLPEVVRLGRAKPPTLHWGSLKRCIQWCAWRRRRRWCLRPRCE